MKLTQPKPFTFEGGNRAVLLLHGFTGNSADERMLGRYLESRGYTCHAPQYKGHGVPPEELVDYGPSDWWKDCMRAYDRLRAMGHKEIAVAGLSLGGVFSLKLGYTGSLNLFGENIQMPLRYISNSGNSTNYTCYNVHNYFWLPFLFLRLNMTALFSGTQVFLASSFAYPSWRDTTFARPKVKILGIAARH